MSRTRSLLMCAAATLALATTGHDPAEAATRLDIALSGARVDVANGGIVASFDATGDVRGMLTARISTANDGSLRGEWVLVSRYLRDLTPEGEYDPRAIDERAALPGWELHGRHKEYFEIHERGSLRGSISGGSLDFDVDGKVRGIQALQLTIEGGDLEFKGVTGTGSLAGSNLQSEAGTGALSLAAVPAQEVK